MSSVVVSFLHRLQPEVAIMAELRTGDPCPCCGQPIKSKDPDVLRLLNWIRDQMQCCTDLLGIVRGEREGKK